VAPEGRVRWRSAETWYERGGGVRRRKQSTVRSIVTNELSGLYRRKELRGGILFMFVIPRQ